MILNTLLHNEHEKSLSGKEKFDNEVFDGVTLILLPKLGMLIVGGGVLDFCVIFMPRDANILATALASFADGRGEGGLTFVLVTVN